mgnify:CR=1 FL=1
MPGAHCPKPLWSRCCALRLPLPTNRLPGASTLLAFLSEIAHLAQSACGL